MTTTRQQVLGELVDRILEMSLDHPTRVGIDGHSAAGKTTLVAELAAPCEKTERPVLHVMLDHVKRHVDLQAGQFAARYGARRLLYDRPMQRRLRWTLGGIVVAILAAGMLALTYPSVAAATCPGCYGLTRVSEAVYSERSLTAEQKAQLVGLAVAARRQVEVFYGDRKSEPRLIACFTDECYDRLGGGGEKGVAVLNRAVMLSPRGLNSVIASHEMAHVELHRRLDGEVPQWFDEGLAVVVSDDPRYLGEHCGVPFDGPLPETLSAWLDAARADQQVYSKAACRVQRWLDANGGRDAVLTLIDQINNGAAFPAIR